MGPVVTAEPTELLIAALFRFQRAVRQAGSEMDRSDLGISRPDVMLLFWLHQYEKEVRLSDAAGHLYVDASVVSRQVGALEEVGYVSRRSDPEDGRASLITLTSKGHDCVLEMKRRHMSSIAGAVDGWSDDRIRDATDLLQELADGLTARSAAHERST